MPSIAHRLSTRRRHVLAVATLLATAAGALVWSDVAASVAASTGPDVTVIYLDSISSWGVSGGYHGYSVGTTSCNVGTTPVAWCEGGGCGGGATAQQHPVIGQNLYRLAPVAPETNPQVVGRFEQIGMSWLKHGFLSLNTPDGACKPSTGCVQPPFGGEQLGVGCTDAYGSGLNGTTPLGRRSEVDPTNGTFPFPYTSVPPGDVSHQHVRVLQTDVLPANNPGAIYWVEGHYVTADDAAAGNGLNNASYNRVTISGASPNISLSGATIREKSAIEGWKDYDPSVELFDADVPSVPIQRFHIARKVTQPSAGVWHYEYALHNMNANRAARAFTVYFPTATTISNVGFHDTDNQPGEVPASTTDWTASADSAEGFVSWFTERYADNPAANSLRWGMTYSFWFDANQPPTGIEHAIELYTPGSPSTIANPNILLRDGFEAGSGARWN
jgi:hypothetical protein